MIEKRALVAVAVFAAILIGDEALIRLDPELQVPSRGVLAEMWRALRDGGHDNADVASIMMPRLPPGLRPEDAARWIEDDLFGHGRGRLKRAGLFCPLAE